MNGGLLRLLRQSGVYALAGVAVKLGGLLLAPLYLDTALLSQESYGHLVLLEVTAQVGIQIAGLGLGSGLLRFMADPAYREIQRALPFTALIASGLAATVVGGMFWLSAPALTPLLLRPDSPPELLQLLGVYVGFKVVGMVPFSLLRSQERAGLYTVAAAAEIAALVGGVYYFLGVEQLGLVGVIQAYALSAFASAAVLIGAMLMRVRWQLAPRLIGRLAQYGAPLALGGLASLFLNVGDRYLLDWLMDAETVAVYGWAARLGGVLNVLLVQSLQLAFLVVGLKVLYRADGTLGDGRFHLRVFRHYAAFAGFAALGLGLFTYDLTRWLSSDASYLGADVLVLPIALGFLAYGLYFIIVNVLYAVEETKRVSVGVVGAAVGNALLNILLIPLLGALGAALATVLSFLGLAFYADLTARRYVPIRYPWHVPAVASLLAVGLWVLAQPSLAWSVPVRLVWRVGLLGVYAGGLVLSGVYRGHELRVGWDYIRRLGRKLEHEEEHTQEAD
ncbi:MAG: oligosaccharide flippase family protein [Rhodothermaceae bacterium]|nr:oligosaccharide flippase family protein [Rhodothermaceae bacterium]